MTHDSSAPASLTRQESIRYSRHLVLPEVGPVGQAKLKRASVACVGAGGLGSPVALYLAAAGVGRIGLIDDDAVDASNLQRQVLFKTADVGRPKTAAAKAALAGLNPDIEIVAHDVRLEAGNALDVLSGYDIVVDGADNFPTRYLVNDACVLLGKPEVWASIYRWEGQVSVFDAARGPCYRCLFPQMPAAGTVPSCEEGGVVGVLPGILGTLQANEAIKLILGIGDPLVGRLLVFDAMGGRFEELRLGKDPACPACSPGAVLLLRDEAAFCAVPGAGAGAAGGTGEGAREAGGEAGGEGAGVAGGLTVSVEWLRDRLSAGTPPVLVDCRQPYEWDICHLDPSVLVPLAELSGRMAALDPAAETVVLCHHGPRSLYAAQFLRQAGFKRVTFLEGGLDAWAVRIDSTMPRY